MVGSEELLVSSIGTTEYEEVVYELENEHVRADFSPVALVKLLDIEAVLVPRTEEAGKANDKLLKEAFEEEEVDYEFVDIEIIYGGSDVDSVLQTVADSIQGNRFEQESVVLDISHSFRTLPIVFLLSLMHLEALDEVTLEKIYYSRFAGSPDHDVSPVIDLTYLHTLMKWYDAFEDVQRSGTLRGISTLLDEKREVLFEDDVPNPERHKFAKAVGSFGGAQKEIDAGFPLEAGIKANNALERLSHVEEDAFVGPEGTILEPLELLLDKFDSDQDVTDKDELKLDEGELRRQADIVEFYLEHEKYWIAIEVARELLVNRFLYDAGLTDEWLDYETRDMITPASGDKHEYFTHDVAEVQKLWDRISNARNTYAHVGFKRDNRSSDANIEEWIEKLCQNITNDDFWRPSVN